MLSRLKTSKPSAIFVKNNIVIDGKKISQGMYETETFIEDVNVSIGDGIYTSSSIIILGTWGIDIVAQTEHKVNYWERISNTVNRYSSLPIYFAYSNPQHI